MTLWGSGNPKREFLHVNDMAEACIHLIKHLNANMLYESGVSHVNIGSSVDLSIRELANIVAQVIGYTGGISFDTTKPDGTPRKLLDVSRSSKVGWSPFIDLVSGLKETFKWYKSYIENS